MILANLSPAAIGLVDTAMVGRLGSPSFIGAVAVNTVLFGFLFTALNFLRIVSTGRSAQAFGARDGSRLRHSLAQGLLFAFALAGLLLLLREPLFALGIEAIGPSEAVATLARQYYDLRLWSAPASLGNYVLIGTLVGMGSGGGPLVMVLAANGLNLLLDLLLVLKFDLGIQGVAWASLAAEYFGAAVGLVLLGRRVRGLAGHWPTGLRELRQDMRWLLGANAVLFARTLALMFVFAFMTTAGARLGDAVLAANAILINMQYCTAYVLDGFANAAEAGVGQAIGERNAGELRLINRHALAWSLGSSLALSALYLGGGPRLFGWITDLDNVRSIAATHLPWVAALAPLSALAFHYDGVFIGALRHRAMGASMLIAVGAVFLPVWALSRDFGNDGLWAAFLAFNLARGVLQQLWFSRWQRRGELLLPV